jgi:hypothetical protein
MQVAAGVGVAQTLGRLNRDTKRYVGIEFLLALQAPAKRLSF